MDHAGLFLSIALIAPLMIWIGWDRQTAQPRPLKKPLKTTPIRFASQERAAVRTSAPTTSTFETNP